MGCDAGTSNLGRCYDFGVCGVEKILKNISLEISLFERATQNGFASAQRCLGYVYEKGLGVAWDLSKTFYWCECVTKQGNLEAEYSLGVYYAYIRSNFIEVSKLLERCDHNDCRYHWMVFCIYKQFLLYINDYIDETQIYDAYETAMSLALDYLKYRFRKEQTKNNPDFEFLIFNQEKLKREYENLK